MKKSTLVKIFVIVLSVFIIIAFLISILGYNSSNAMLELRDFEHSLDLPQANVRSENDRGCSTDLKGVYSCHRSIFLYFSDASIRPKIEEEIIERGWRYRYGERFGKRIPFDSWSGDEVNPICLGTSNSNDTNDNGFSIVISGFDDGSCRSLAKNFSEDE